MDPTLSVSKGCFVFKPQTKKKHRTSFDFQNTPWYQSYKTLWNKVEGKMMNVYEEVYSKVLKDLIYFVEHSHDKQPQSLLNHNILPSATLITGINMPDHGLLFDRLFSLLSGVTEHVAVLNARDCTSVKAAVEQTVSQFMNLTTQIKNIEDSDDETTGSTLRRYQCNFMVLKAWYQEQLKAGEERFKEKAKIQNSPRKKTPLKTSALLNSESNSPNSSPRQKRKRVVENSSPLKSVKTANGNQSEVVSPKKHIPCEREGSAEEDVTVKKPLLVVVMPDFESFSPKVLQDFITIASSHAGFLPITLVFGVATSVMALHSSLPYHVSSKLSVEVFHSQKSYVLLDHMLEKVFLMPDCPFHLSGRTFRLFGEVFMFYDFSVQGFMQSLKFCMMEHFFNRNVNRLCCTLDELPRNIAQLDSSDFADLKEMDSLKKYIETSSKEAILKDNKLFKVEVTKLLHDLHIHLFVFYTALRVLHVMTATLPNAPLEKQIRHMYGSAISEWINRSPEYKECFKLLGFQSRDELLEKINKVLDILSDSISTDKEKATVLLEFREKLTDFASRIEDLGMSQALNSPSKIRIKSPRKTPTKSAFIDTMQKKVGNRSDYYRSLAVCQELQPLSAYEQERLDLLTYLSTTLGSLLAPLTSLPLHELLLFDNVSTVKRHIIGAPRAAIHMVLNNPQYYLQCQCCTLANTSNITSNLPDLSIVYKLHLECGKMINLYDWLQSFVAIVSPEQKRSGTSEDVDEPADTDHREVDPEIQARFARAVAELQLLGFIKASKKKVDHVSRLTFNPK